MKFVWILLALMPLGAQAGQPPPKLGVITERHVLEQLDRHIVVWDASEHTECKASGDWEGPIRTKGRVDLDQPLMSAAEYSLTCINMSGHEVTVTRTVAPL